MRARNLVPPWPREPRAGCFSSGSLHEKTGDSVCARVRPCSVDKPNDRALPGGPAPFTSPPRVIGVWPSHAITSGNSFGAGYLTISQDQFKHLQSRPGATRLEVGPRESRAGSRVPIYTSSSPAVQATCQGGVVHAPRALLIGSPSHAPVEAPCSVLAVDTVEERLCPCKSGSTMVHVSDKQLGVASRPH